MEANDLHHTAVGYGAEPRAQHIEDRKQRHRDEKADATHRHHYRRSRSEKNARDTDQHDVKGYIRRGHVPRAPYKPGDKQGVNDELCPDLPLVPPAYPQQEEINYRKPDG